ncbi:MAG: glycosyltransferase family 4 protein, partial [Bacteroidota bacterium]
LGRYDLIFIQREALFIGTSVFEYFMGRSKVPVIFDFDDSIWIRDVSQGNRKLGWLKRPSKTAKIIRYADMVFAGNSYLANYASGNNKNVIVIPTTIDTSYHNNIRKSEKTGSRVCIGWTGTETTIKHYETILPVLIKLKEKYEDRIYMKVIADIPFSGNGLEIQSEIWKLETEIESLREFDIGIMPLPDDQWSKGKCGLKGLQYMALEIPVVLSGVGINAEIICDGKNGFLANTGDEWIEKLSLLIESAGLRKTLGREGRKTVIEKYSVESQKEKYLFCFRQLTDKGR